MDGVTVTSGGKEVLRMPPHYGVNYSIKSLDDLFSNFFENGPDEFNWLFASTSGVHGTYTDLDDIEESIKGARPEEDRIYDLTVVAFHPRTCFVNYGNVKVTTLGEVALLRRWIAQSLKAVAETQAGNMPKRKKKLDL